MKVTFQKQVIEIDLLDPAQSLSLQSTVGELKQHLSSQCDVTQTRLIMHGKLLGDDEAPLHTLSEDVNAQRLTMTASARKEIDALADASRRPVRIRDDLSSSNSKSKDIKRKLASPFCTTVSRGTNRGGLSGKSGFGDVEVLPGLPEEERARELLRRLAQDPGIVAVMQKRGWFVPTLAELYPQGYVGVSDVCLMGLNQNKGQKILLRIRTDDLRGFRKYLSIKQVLYHELAHNVHGDHDDAFYMLMREIERDALALDWTRSTGHALGHEIYRGDSDRDGDYSVESEAETETVFRLGGASVVLKETLPAEVLAREAALRRLQERAIEDEKESEATAVSVVEQTEQESDAVAIPLQTEIHDEKSACDSPAEKQDDISSAAAPSTEEVVNVPADPAANVSSSSSPSVAAITMENGEPPQEDAASVHLALQRCREELFARLDESIAVMSSSDALASALDRVIALRFNVLEAVFDALERDFVAVSKALQTVLKIVSNAKTGELKFRTIKRNNNVLQRALVSLGQSGTDLLFAAGFEAVVANGESVFEWRRNDVALLCIVQELIEAILDQCRCYIV